MALVTTIGGTTSNSYVSVTEANTYFASTLRDEEWVAHSAYEQELALIEAARWLNEERYFGSKTNTTQALKFPRRYIKDDEGVAFEDDVIPTVVKNAQCELALALLKSPELLADDGLERFSELSLGRGDVTVGLRTGTGSRTLPVAISRLLRPLRLTGMRALRS